MTKLNEKNASKKLMETATKKKRTVTFNQLKKESRMVRKESMKVLSEFENCKIKKMENHERK